MQLRGDEVLDTLDAFPTAIDAQQPGREQRASLALGQVAPDHDILFRPF